MDNFIVNKNEKILLKCESLYVLNVNNKIVISDGWKTDYPINYGNNDKGEFLGTGYDGTFFYSNVWVKYQDEILDFIKDFHTKQLQGVS